MAYISSSANRWYCGREAAYGQVATITADNRIPAVKLTARQQREKSNRKDKTGSRTWQGTPGGGRKQTSFDLSTYVRDWSDTTKLPGHGPLMEAALGAPGMLFEGGVTDVGCTANTVKFVQPHGLTPGQGISIGSDLRFVGGIADTTTIVLSCPLSNPPAAGMAIGATATYAPAEALPSVTLYDFWGTSTAVQRLFTGAAVDQFKVQLNGDYHQFDFKGMAQDLVDNVSFQSGEGGLPVYPAEPLGATGFSYSIVPGNLGQVWLGAIPNQFLTVADATIEVRNNIELRANEFGSSLPRAIAPGEREVTINLELFAMDDANTLALYQAARQHVPISMMFQLGQTGGQMVGIYLKSVVPDVPEFDDGDKRLKWKFRDSRAQGTADDEIVVAFG